jgi:hypothetical protein
MLPEYEKPPPEEKKTKKTKKKKKSGFGFFSGWKGWGSGNSSYSYASTQKKYQFSKEDGKEDLNTSFDEKKYEDVKGFTKSYSTIEILSDDGGRFHVVRYTFLKDVPGLGFPKGKHGYGHDSTIERILLPFSTYVLTVVLTALKTYGDSKIRAELEKIHPNMFLQVAYAFFYLENEENLVRMMHIYEKVKHDPRKTPDLQHLKYYPENFRQMVIDVLDKDDDGEIGETKVTNKTLSYIS